MAGLCTRFHRVVLNDWGTSCPAFTAYGGEIQATRFAGGRWLNLAYCTRRYNYLLKLIWFAIF